MAIPPFLTLDVVTPDRAVVQEQVDEVQIPGAQGYLGVLPGHTPLMTLLDTGTLWYRKGQERTYLFVGFGFAEVLPDHVTILARVVERAEEIDVGRAERARARAEERLAKPSPGLEVERARIALQKAHGRLQVAARARATA